MADPELVNVSSGSVSDPPVILVSNRHCRIERQSLDLLKCSTQGKLGTQVIFFIGMIAVYGSIALIAWHLPDGILEPYSLIGGFLMLAFGLFLQWRSVRRHKELGEYEVDRGDRILRKQGNKGSTVSFEEIVFVRLVFDKTAGMRMGSLYWLFIHCRKNPQFRIGRGTKDELKPVLVWLKMAGLPVSLQE